ncbi:MAG: F0F1 ATP synthase subunit gamma [Oscillospiraceae bacterium]|jgi:F-type H+-transporting ATPase subunit gamma|nr:F0F1 ATP synthase subunit gamma [Oscillospiraceae bacterium]
MQKPNEIKRHIQAIEETRKITNAMHLVSSVRAKKVIRKMDYNRRFLRQTESCMKDVLIAPHLADNRYLRRHEHKKRTYIVISGDKGLAGAYNTNVLGLAYREITEKMCRADHGDGTQKHTHNADCLLCGDARKDLTLITIGMMGQEYFHSRGIEPDEHLGGVTQDPSLFNARTIAYDILERFDKGETDQVFLVYTPFVSGAAGEPMVRRILPIRLSNYILVEETEPAHNIMIHPSEDEAFEQLVPQYLVGYIYGALMHAYASEHVSRMAAMQSATRNADEMLDKLKLQYNMARQAAVTQELAEIRR